jgi:hypothetical protein
MALLRNHARKAIPVSLLLLLALLLVPSLSRGQTFDNVGFKKNVPPELRQKFPVCDEFLDVKWIDPERYVGRVEVTDYLGDNYNGEVDLLLVPVPNPYGTREAGIDQPFATYIIYDSCGKDCDAFIKSARFEWSGIDYLTIQKGKRKVKFSRMFIGPHMWYHEVSPPPANRVIESPSIESLASFTRNVCVVEPKGDVAIVVEEKEPFYHGMPTKASWQRYQAILKAAQKHCDELVHKEGKQTCDMDQVAFGTSIDATGDGKEDYVSEFAVTNPRGTQEGRVFALLSNNSGFVYIPKSCEVAYWEQRFSYHANERSLYYGPCNLTKMIKGVK